ncbi:hypothetical protein V8E53_002217 [Lactarius tabidus]
MITPRSFAASSWCSTATGHVVYTPVASLCATSKHHVRIPLPYKIENGMGDFLSPAALKVLAEDYQQGLLNCTDECLGRHEARNQSVAQIVISTASDESQTLAFNYASLALNNSFFLHHLKPPNAPAQNHKSSNRQTSQPRAHIDPGRHHRRPTRLTQGLKNLRRCRCTRHVGANTLLFAEQLQPLAPDGVELGGIYEPAALLPPNQLPPSSSSLPSGRVPAQARALSTSARTSASRPANVWSDPALSTSDTGAAAGSSGMYGSSETPTALDALGRTPYPLFCVSLHEHA